jgi:hypothetical protein
MVWAFVFEAVYGSFSSPDGLPRLAAVSINALESRADCGLDFVIDKDGVGFRFTARCRSPVSTRGSASPARGNSVHVLDVVAGPRV